MMKISETFINSNQLQGKSVDIHGFFVLVGQEGCFVDSIDERDDRQRAIKIDVIDIKKVAMRNAPPSGGSKYYYLDEAIATGILRQCHDGDFQLALTGVTAFVIQKSGETFKVI